MTIGPFDPSDPHDQMSERIRQLVIDAISEALSRNDDLGELDRLSAIIGGVSTALCCYVAACVAPHDRQRVVKMIAESTLPQSLVLAESILQPPRVQ